MFPPALSDPIVPITFRKAVFDHFHNVAHPGRLTSRCIFSSRFVWRRLSSDITAWASGCLACQRKIHRHTCLAPQPIPILQRSFSHLHVDLVGPLQYSKNCCNMVRGATLFTPRTPRTAKGRHWSFPAEAVFGSPIVLPNEFLQNEELSVDSIIKNFPKPCMFLLLLCLGTILAPSCPASCLPSCSPPPSSGSTGAASFHPFSRSMTAALRQRTPRPAACITASDRRVHAQAVPPQPSRSHLQTRWFLRLLLWCCHKTAPELFSYPARRFSHAQNQQCLHSLHRHSTGPVNGYGQRGLTSDRFSFQPRPELGRSPVESLLHSWDSQTSPAYSSNPVQYLFINCYVTANKLVLSYLLLRLLLQLHRLH